MPDLEPLIASIIAEGQDMVVATIRPDGSPQTTVVSYASDGLALYFGDSTASQKAQNLERDDRVSIAITLPYKDWSQIRGISLFGHARKLTDPADLFRVGQLFLSKFPEIARYVMPGGGELAMFEVAPQMISVLDYRQGFGHTDLVRVLDVTKGAIAAA